MKQELWKTASLDRNPQLNQAHIAQRYAIGNLGFSHISAWVLSACEVELS